MERLETENGVRERVCREVEEEVRERKGHRGQKPGPRTVAAHHGSWPLPLANRDVYWSLFFFDFSGLAPPRPYFWRY